MGEERVDAGGGLLRLHGVHREFSFVALFIYGQDAQGGDGFERVVGIMVTHAEADGRVVHQKNDGEESEGRHQNKFGEAEGERASQRQGVSTSLTLWNRGEATASTEFGYGFGFGTSTGVPILMVEPNRL